MNAKRLLLNLTFFASIVLSACAPAAPVALDTAPTAVVESFYQILGTGNVSEAMTLTADDYVMNDPFGTYDRTAAATQWQAVLDAGLTFNQSNFVETGNGRVTSCYEVFENGNLIDQGCGAVTYVRDGKIVFDGLEQAEKIWIAQEFYEAINTSNLESAMVFVADDVQCRGACYLNGKDSFRTYNQANIDMEGTIELENFQVSGNEVTYEWIASSDAGFVLARGEEIMRIENGLIHFLDTRM